MAKKKDTKVIMARNTIIGFITVVAIAILGFGTYVSTDLADGKIVANEDYRVLDNPRPRRAEDPIEVVEFFSYGCVHCKNFDPMVDEWAAELQKIYVEYDRLLCREKAALLNIG